MKKKSFYFILVPIILWILQELFVFKSSLFFISLSFGVLAIIFCVRYILKHQSSKFWPPFVIAPVLFYLSFSFYSAVIVSPFWIQVIFLMVAGFMFSYFHNINNYFSFGTPEREAMLRRLLLIGSFLSAFAYAATFYALPIFLSWPPAILILAFAFISLALFGQFLVLNGNHDKETRIFWGVNTFVITECAAIFFLLPLNYNVLGILLAVIFYFLIILDEWRHKGLLNWKNLRWPVAISVIIFTIILLSARWL